MSRRTGQAFVTSRYPGNSPDSHLRDWPGGNGPSIFPLQSPEVYAHGQAQAYIISINHVHGQAQGSIKQTYNQHGQCQAQIKQVYTQHGQAQAYILFVQYVHGQAQGSIDSDFVFGTGQAQAWIETTYYALGQANAIIKKTIFLDTFTRSAGPLVNQDIGTLGLPDIGVYGELDIDASQVTNIDGSKLVKISSNTPNYLWMQTSLQAANIEAGMSFTSDQFDSEFYADIELGSFVYAYIYGTEFGLYAHTNLELGSFTLVAGNTYRLVVGVFGTEARAKIWDVSGPEPDWMLRATSDDPLALDKKPIAISSESVIAAFPETTYFDNFRVETTDNTVEYRFHGQAMASIHRYQGYAQAQALIIRRQGYGQARAVIHHFRGYGQARASIYYRRFHGQARAKIFKPAVAQAQALIWRPQGYGQAMAKIITYTPNAYAQALIRVIGISYVAQAQAHIFIRRRPLAQAQADIKQTYFRSAQAQALIHKTTVHGQAGYYLESGTLIVDTFTRVYSNAQLEQAVVSGTFLPDIGPAYGIIQNNFFPQSPQFDLGVYSNSKTDGNYIVTSGADDYDFVDAYVPIYSKNNISQIDFKASVISDWAYLASLNTRFKNDFSAVGCEVYYDPDLDRTAIEIRNFWVNQVTAYAEFPTVSGDTWYTLKFEANEDILQAKFWRVGDSEPGWQVSAIIPPTDGTYIERDLEPGMANFYADTGEWIGEHPDTPIVYLDNWNVQGDYLLDTRTNRYSQAQAYLSSNTQKHGQARARIAYPLVGSTLIHLDTFTREGNVGVIGIPDIGTYNGATSIPGGIVSNGVLNLPDEVAQIRTGGTGENVEAYFDFKFSSLSEFMFISLEARAGLSTASMLWSYEGEISYFVLAGDLYEVAAPEVDVWYTFKLRTDYTIIRAKYWERDDPEPDWQYQGIAATATGGVDIDFDQGFDVPTVQIDNFNVYRLDPASPYSGQAQGYISTTLYRIPGQAQAYIRLYKGSGQAQAHIRKRINRHGLARAVIARTGKQARGQAQARITPWYYVQGNAQGYITKPQRMAQAQARILAFGQVKSSQCQARILAKTVTYAHGQCLGLIKMPAFGQAAALISGARYLVRYNGYDLPGYAQEESLQSIMDIHSQHVTYENGTLAEYTGLQNKIISLRMRAWRDTYGNVKRDAQNATTMLRSAKGFTKLYIQNYNKHYVALAKSIKAEKTVGESMRILDYSVEWEVMPWLVSDITYTISGVNTVTTDAVGRTIYNGGFSPVRISVDGTNVTVSGYNSAGHFTGYISVSGTVTNLLIDSEAYTATINGQNANNVMYTPNYQTYVGPGKTTFVITGATRAEISWEDRWYL